MSAQCFVDSFRLTSSPPFGTIYTRTGYGFRPKFLFIWGSGFADADEVAGADARMNVGFATPNGQCALGTFHVDAGAATDTYRVHDDRVCWCSQTTGAGTTDLTVASFDADGVTLVYGTLFGVGSSFRIHILALGGDDITNIGVAGVPAVAAATQDVDSFGFQPDMLFLASISNGTNFQQASAVASFSLGVVDTALNNAVIAHQSEDAVATSNTKGYCRSGDSILTWGNTGAVDGRGRVTAWRPNGFTVTWDNQPGGNNIFAIAVKGVRCTVKTGTTQTDTTTNIAITGAGFTPIGGIVCGASRAQSTADIPTAHAMTSIGAFNSASSEKAAALWDENATAGAECANANEFDACLINISATDTLAGAMHVQSIDSDGVTFRMATADPAGNFFWTLLFGSWAENTPGAHFDGFVSASDQNLTTYDSNYSMLLETAATLLVSGTNDRVQATTFGAESLAIRTGGNGSRFHGGYTVEGIIGAEGPYSGLIGVRGKNDNGAASGYFIRIHATFAEARLYRYYRGALTLLDTWTITVASPGSKFVRVSVAGVETVTIRTLIDGVERVYNDTSGSRITSGYPIVGCYRESGALYVDDFAVLVPRSLDRGKQLAPQRYR